jgi:hypothetical protein
MKYENFSQFLQIPNINSSDHMALALQFSSSDEQEFLEYFLANSENIKLLYHHYSGGYVYVITNTDAVLNESLGDYETVTDLPEKEQI